MSFPEYWKEISLVLAGVFAIMSVVWKPKDETTGRITPWGRVFICLTILAILCGVFAQWQESTNDAKRAASSQEQMLQLLSKTDRAVTELARVLQPLDPSDATLYLSIDCTLEALKNFCDSIRAQGDAYAAKHPDELAGLASIGFKDDVLVDDLNWQAWPGPISIVQIRVSFLKSSSAVEDFIRKGCSTCDPPSDAKLVVQVTPRKGLSARYAFKSKRFQIMVDMEPPIFTLQTKKIMSLPDLPGSTAIFTEPNGFLDKLVPANFLLHMVRGLAIQITEFKPIDMSGHRIFIHSFPVEGQ